jgi:hypothetical protein
MDFISHGLWGSIAFGRKNRLSFWMAFLFGMAPDVFSFGAFFISVFLGIQEFPPFGTEPPDPSLIPHYVSNLYNISHSLVIFLLVFALVWLIRKKPLWEASAWGLHILFDIPTHAHGFFPTPFLWPLFDVKVDGIPWTDPVIFIPNVALLLILYLYFFWYRKLNNIGK